MNNLDRLNNVFVAILEIDSTEVNSDLKYDGNSSWDSINHMFLINELESEFNIEIDSDHILEMKSFENVKTLLGSYGITF